MATGIVNRVVPITSGGTGQTEVLTFTDNTNNQLIAPASEHITISSVTIRIWGKVLQYSIVFVSDVAIESGGYRDLGTLSPGFRPSMATGGTARILSVTTNPFITATGDMKISVSANINAGVSVRVEGTFLLA